MNPISVFIKKISPPSARPGEVNYHFVDRFTAVHFLIGWFYAYLGFNVWLMFFLAVFWELVENPLKKYCKFMFPHATADTLSNMVGDVIAVSLGWYLYMML